MEVRRLPFQAAAQLAKAMAKLRPPPTELFRDLGGYAARHGQLMEPPQLAMLLSALLQVDLPPPPGLCDTLAVLCRGRLPGECLKEVAEAYASCGGRDPEILQDLRLAAVQLEVDLSRLPRFSALQPETPETKAVAKSAVAEVGYVPAFMHFN